LSRQNRNCLYLNFIPKILNGKQNINNQIKVLRRVKLSIQEKIEHWLNFLFLSVPILIYPTTIFIAEGTVDYFVAIPFLIIFILFLRHKILFNKLKEYSISISNEEFKLANMAASRLNGWIIMTYEDEYFEAIQFVDWNVCGFKITAFLKDKNIYLSSMVNPHIKSHPLSFGVNRNNINELLKQYKLILKGENVLKIENATFSEKERKSEFWNQSEWSTKNVLFRIVVYLAIILLTSAGILMIIEGEILFGLTFIGICAYYVSLDIGVIRQKNKDRY
jgi:hypothetical protein